MDFTQEQISAILDGIANSENGFENLLKHTLEAIMRSERMLHNENSNDQSNGFRKRSVLAHGGKIELLVPRSRHHNFYPLLLGVIKNQENEYKELAYQLYTAGLTTEQVGDMFDKIYGQHYSKAAISNMMHTAKTDVTTWLERSLNDEYGIIYIDATYWHTRRVDSVSQEAYYTILGVKNDYTREVLSIINHPTEGSSNWKEEFERLKNRGVKNLKLIVCDGLTGIENAIGEVFPMATIQLCTVHLQRNIQAKVKPCDKAEISNELKGILNPDDTNVTAQSKHIEFKTFIDKWKVKYSALSVYLSNRYAFYFNYFNYHIQVRRMIYTTNWIERLNRSYKRTLRMRSSMPSPQSVLFLLGSVAMNRKEYNGAIYQFSYEQKLFHKFDVENQNSEEAAPII